MRTKSEGMGKEGWVQTGLIGSSHKGAFLERGTKVDVNVVVGTLLVEKFLALCYILQTPKIPKTKKHYFIF